MDKDKQRIAIAEACGWDLLQKGWVSSVIGRSPFSRTMRYSNLDEPPDYLNDLNAMHDAEKMLNANQANLYRKTLSGVTANAYIGSDHPQLCYAEHATADQRAEAFLRTLNLWTPTGEENE